MIKNLTIFIVLLTILFSACDNDSTDKDKDKNNYFELELRGTWESADKSVYSGRLEIDYDTIKITGYSEDQVQPGDDDKKLPFKDIIKNTSLKGYSEKGKIFIVDYPSGGISYTYKKVGISEEETLTISFPGRNEVLIKIDE